MDSSSSSSCSFGAVSSLPSPKSPPEYPDLYGKRRELAKIQLLEKEIGLLQEELKSIQGLKPASTCCKELDDFINAKLDPLVTVPKSNRKSRCWKKLWGWSCCKLPSLSVCKCATCCFKRRSCCSCCISSDQSPGYCCRCLKKLQCRSCCNFSMHSCRKVECCKMRSLFCKCKMVILCCTCPKSCI